ncbi:MAG: DUF2079 domain-containing protein [Candidatus Sumerlaeaceae bacterium]|nr:DUF2079 domain-containing protein [Candidatus Sumerlaeaceae bacterium]
MRWKPHNEISFRRGFAYHESSTIVVVILGTVLAFAYMEWIALSQWLTGRWYLADVGNIHYCLFNTWYDGFMNSPLMGHNNHFAFHFTPFLLLLSPLIFLCVYPVPLVTTYILALALCVPAVFLLARRSRVSPGGSLLLAWLFLSNHFVGSLELANHFEVFYVLFAILAIALRATRWLIPCTVLAASVKEDAALWLGGWLIVEWWLSRDPRERRRYLVTAIILGCYVIVAATTIITLQRICGRGAVTDYAGRFRDFGPGGETLVMFALLLASFATLPLFSGRRLVLCFIPFPMLLATFPFMRLLLYYYSYPFLPFFIYAACYGWRRVHVVLRRRYGTRVGMLLGVTVFALATLQWFLPTRTDGYYRRPFSIASRDWYRFHLARDLLPADAPLALQFGLWGITPHRLGTHLLAPHELKSTDWVFMDLQSPHGLSRDEFIAVARQVLGDVEAGKRKVLHTVDDIFVITPVTTATDNQL